MVNLQVQVKRSSSSDYRKEEELQRHFRNRNTDAQRIIRMPTSAREKQRGWSPLYLYAAQKKEIDPVENLNIPTWREH
jgi:hypothetical protein